MPKSPIKTRDYRKIDWEAVRARMARGYPPKPAPAVDTRHRPAVRNIDGAKPQY